MNNLTLKPQPLNSKDFTRFGEVLELNQGDYYPINDGFAKKYPDIATIDINKSNGLATVHIFIAKKRKFPLKIDMMEHHPFFSQTFIPRDKTPFLLIVAPAGEKLEIDKLKVFITNGEQGVNYKRGTWHFPLISLKDDNQFIVIDRKYQGNKDIEQCVITTMEAHNINIEYKL